MQGGTFLYPALFKTVLLPPFLILVFSHLLPLTISFLLSFLLYISSWPALFILRSYLSTLRSTLRARQLGARNIPRVRGRLPLNFDVLLDWSRSGSEEEVGRMMVLLGRRYGGTYNTRVLGEDSIISTDPAVIRHVLVDDFDNFIKGKKFYQRAEGFLGDGIFNSDGERWKFVRRELRTSPRSQQHRALTRPFFHPTHISPTLFTPLVRSFMADLPVSQAIDIQSQLGDLALKMAILWLCGKDLSAESGVMPPGWGQARDGLGGALVECQRVVGKRVKIGTIWPLFEIGKKPLERPMRVIRAFFEPLIDKALERKRQGQEGQHLIDRLVRATDDRKLIQDQLINLLLASRDTTTSLLTFMVYSLALHPDVALRLRAESATLRREGGGVTKDTIRDMRLARSFINESLRLFPPVPLNIRRTARPSLLPSPNGGKPLYMPANTSIILTTVLAHRDKSVWGEDAEVFDIDRWSTMGKEREAFTSWNIGPRMCLGQPLALTLAHTFLFYLLGHLDQLSQSSRIVIREEAKDEACRIPRAWLGDEGDGRARSGRDRVWIVADVVLAVKGGLWVSIEP